jgi:outer membrane murein-binding lipoprotein Lpp
MVRYSGRRFAFLASVALAALPVVYPAQVQALDADRGVTQQMNTIKDQIKSLQDQLRAMQRTLSARDSQVRAAQRDAARAREEAERIQPAPVAIPSQPPPAPGLPGLLGQPNNPALPYAQPQNAGAQNAAAVQGPTQKGTFQVGGVTITLGGFIEAASIFRSRNEVADITSNLGTGVPLRNQQTYHEAEFRESARQSRLAMLIQGNVDPHQTLAAYFETDFISAGTTSNSNESNSYTLRLRHAFATYDNTNWGFHFLGGQSWSLLTMDKVGIIPRQEAIPYTIEAQYVSGFEWARQAQLRFVKDFGKKVWLGVSFESPQSIYYTSPNALPTSIGTVNTTNAGGSGLNSTNQYSDDIAPDTIVKLALDPGWGHYEVYGLLKWIHDRVSVVGDGRNNTVAAGGGGVGMRLPLLPNDRLYFRASALAGYGIGRYGSSQLPDAVLRPDGRPQPLPEVEALFGLESTILHKSVDLYAYVGTEQLGREAYVAGGKAYGYGNRLYVNSGCGVELSPSTCTGNTSGVWDGTLGFWWRPLVGPFGTAQVGAEYEYLRRNIFSGVGGSKGGDDNIVLLSFRYLPFQ